MDDLLERFCNTFLKRSRAGMWIETFLLLHPLQQKAICLLREKIMKEGYTHVIFANVIRIDAAKLEEHFDENMEILYNTFPS